MPSVVTNKQPKKHQKPTVNNNDEEVKLPNPCYVHRENKTQ